MFVNKEGVRWYLAQCFLSCGIALLLPTTSFSDLMAQESDICQSKIEEAEEMYRTAYFDQAISLLIECLEGKDISEPNKVAAYKLLGKAYLAKDLLDQAKIALKRMVELDSSIVLDRRFEPPALVALFEEVKKETEIQPPTPPPTPPAERDGKGGKKKWFLIGGGAAVAGVGAAILLSGNGPPPPPPPLPSPPNFP